MLAEPDCRVLLSRLFRLNVDVLLRSEHMLKIGPLITTMLQTYHACIIYHYINVL
jgi:hypothetical protein